MAVSDDSAFRILRKTFHFELNVNGHRSVNMNFPVIRGGKEDSHAWEIFLLCSREQWQKNPNDYNYRYTYRLSVSVNHTDGFKYERSYYTIRVAGDNDQKLATETGDLIGEHYNELKYDKELSFLPYDFSSLWVKVTFQSYIIDFPTQKSLKCMLDKDTLSDLVIKTKGKDFPCHKVVLAIASEYFVKMFEVDMKERQESVVNWNGVFEADVVQDFLHYVYTGYTPPNLTNTGLTLLEMANTLLMDDLKKLCAHQLKAAVTTDNVGDILRMAAKNDSKELQEIAINYIVQSFDGSSTAPWEKVEPEFLTNVVATMIKGMADKKMLL